VRKGECLLAELKVYLSEELDKRFRVLAMRVFGYGRGSLSEAAVDALAKWCEQHESGKGDRPPNDDAVSANSDPVARAEERPGVSSPGSVEGTA